MPQLSVSGNAQSFQTVLDHGITDLVVRESADGPVLYATSGQNGGVSVYSIGVDGALTLIDFVHFAPDFASEAMNTLTVLDTAGGPQLVVAGGGGGSLTTYHIAADGTLGAIDTFSGLMDQTGTVLALDQWDGDRLFLSPVGSDRLESYRIDPGTTLQRQFSVFDTEAIYGQAVFALQAVSFGAVDYLLAASRSESGVTAYRIEADGLAATGSLGAAEGIGIMTPTALGTTLIGGRCFVIVGSSPSDGIGQSGAITVMELLEDGTLQPTDHVIDTLHTRFGNIQSLDIVESNGMTYVFAAGADGGLTVFLLMPNGRLQIVEVMVNDLAGGLQNTTAIASYDSGDALRLFLSSEVSPGVTEVSMDTSRAGSVLSAAPGGASATGTALDDVILGGSGDDLLAGSFGDDIIEDGAGEDTLSGGGGRDIFVLRGDGSVDVISDFELNRDRIDLSDWPFLYDPSQIDVQSTMDGAIVTWRTETLIIQTAHGISLTATDVIASILSAPNRSPILFSALPEDPDQFFEGSSGPDTIDGGDGNDTIMGEEGADLLVGGAGDDSLLGGLGNDTLDGGADADRIEGNAGDDWLLGGAGDDHLVGGFGNDSLLGGDDRDTLLGEAGEDLLRGGGDADWIEGGDGNDTLRGQTGDDVLFGNAGADIIVGDEGNDRAFAGLGDDLVFGFAGNDTLYGDQGNDTIFGSDGDDLLYGGTGSDDMFGNAGRDTLYGGDDDDIVYGGLDDDLLFGLDGNDTLFGDGGNDAVEGGSGNDLMFGGEGDDLLRGGDGRDNILGGPGDDTIEGNADDDVLSGGDGVDRLRGGDGDDLLLGGAQNDNLGGDAGNDTLHGEAGDDLLLGGEDHDRLFGGIGEDMLYGGFGGDWLSGDEGNDFLDGFFGFDTLIGGSGDDLLSGGGDGDTFVFADGHGVDTIADFDASDPFERIDLTAVTSITGFSDLIGPGGAATQVGADLRIETGGGNRIWLQDVMLGDLDADDFLF